MTRPSWLGAGEYDEMCRAALQTPYGALDVAVKLAEKEAPLGPEREFEAATGGSPPGLVQTQVHCLSSGSGHILQLVNHAESLQLLQPSISYAHNTMFALVPIQLVLPHAYKICAEQDFDGASPYIKETSGPRAQPYTALTVQCVV